MANRAGAQELRVWWSKARSGVLVADYVGRREVASGRASCRRAAAAQHESGARYPLVIQGH